MCEICEGKAPIKTELKMKLCYIENHVVGIESGTMRMTSIVQQADRPPYLIETNFDCDFCPKCGRSLRLDGVAIGNAEELKKLGIDIKKHNSTGLYRGITTKKENRREFNEIYVEGDLIHSGGKVYIHPVHNRVKVENELGRIIVMHEVKPDTVTQIE